MTYNPLAGYDPPAWLDDALCAQTGPDDYTWFPERRGDHLALARRVCAGCPVRDTCLAWAIAHDEEGLWAGTTKRERRALRREVAA